MRHGNQRVAVLDVRALAWGGTACSAITKSGYGAKPGCLHMRAVKVNNTYQAEYFSPPEAAIRNTAIYASAGSSLDSSMRMELTIDRDRALAVNYKKSAEKAAPQGYGA